MPVVDLSKIGLEGQESYALRAQAMANANNLEASAVETDLANQEAMKMNELNAIAAERLKSGVHRKPGKPDPAALAEGMESLATPLEVVADIYAQGGAIETATDLYKSASEIRKRESDIENDAVTAQQNRLENILKGAEIVGQRFGTAQNDSEWNLAIEETRRDIENGVFSMEPELFEQISQMPFDPDAAAFFRDRAISVTDQARMELTKVQNDRLERVAMFNASNAADRARIAEARLNEDKRHNEVMEKASGVKPVTTPTDNQLKAVRSVLENGPFKGAKTKGDPDFEDAASYVAGQALSLVRQNPAINWDTAVRQATMRAENDGIFGVEKPGLFGRLKGDKPDPKFDGKGRTPDTAIPMPSSKSEMVKGRYYITAKGRAKWDGSSFVLVK